jgi:hypothetical protein
LPHRQAWQLSRIEPYGLFILIGLAITPVLGWILTPPVMAVINLINFFL